MSKKQEQEQNNSDVTEAELIDVKEDLHDIKEEIEQAETLDELRDTKTDLERIFKWATQNALGPIAELTKELKTSNELKRQELERTMKAASGVHPVTPEGEIVGNEAELVDPETAINPEDQAEHPVETEIQEAEKAVDKEARKIIRL